MERRTVAAVLPVVLDLVSLVFLVTLAVLGVFSLVGMMSKLSCGSLRVQANVTVLRGKKVISVINYLHLHGVVSPITGNVSGSLCSKIPEVDKVHKTAPQ